MPAKGTLAEGWLGIVGRKALPQPHAHRSNLGWVQNSEGVGKEGTGAKRADSAAMDGGSPAGVSMAARRRLSISSPVATRRVITCCSRQPPTALALCRWFKAPAVPTRALALTLTVVSGETVATDAASRQSAAVDPSRTAVG